MAAWGFEFYLLVLKVSLSALVDKIRIPALPCNILYFNIILLLIVRCQLSLPQRDQL